jgi:nucleoid-associated protein YgaU
MLPESPEPTKGVLRAVDNPHATEDAKNDHVTFDFNPAKVKLATAVTYNQPAQKKGKKPAAPEYKGPEARTLELELTLNEFNNVSSNKEGKVAEDIATLISFTRPTKSTLNNKPRPPTVQLVWGKDLWNFPCYVKSVTATITMFSTSGAALRATVAVALVEMPKPTYPVNPTSHSRVGQQSHTMLFGESLAAVAHKYYDKPTLWRGLAELNGIDDPTRLRAGNQIYLPPLEDVSAASK